jgi:hypothetical protein
MGYFRALPTGRKCWVTFGPFLPGGSAGLLSGPSYREEVHGVTFGPFLPGGSAWGYFRALLPGGSAGLIEFSSCDCWLGA